MIRTLVALSVFTGTLFAQGRVAPENLYPRVLCVVPMIGAGTPSDPRRPMFVPAPTVSVQPNAPVALANSAPISDQPVDPGPPPPPATPKTGIIAFQYQLTDDGKNAIVELVGADRDALAPIFKIAVPSQAILQSPTISEAQVIVLDRDQTTKPQVEAAFKQFKKDFSLDTFVPMSVN